MVGGTAISGGRGTLLGTLIGVALLATIGPALLFFRVHIAMGHGHPGIDHPARRRHRRVAAEGTLRCRPHDFAAGALPASSDRGLAVGAMPAVQPQQIALCGMLLFEVLIVFSFIGENFRTWDNFFKVLQLIVELGLLALAMTPVIVTGGIDLSVGSLLGLSAIVMGMLWKDAGMPLWIAGGCHRRRSCSERSPAASTRLLITRLRIPPLIVTLGTMSLFRGLAEGITGTKNLHRLSRPAFVFLGQGSSGDSPGTIPSPSRLEFKVILPGSIGMMVGLWLMLHRSTAGRFLELQIDAIPTQVPLLPGAGGDRFLDLAASIDHWPGPVRHRLRTRRRALRRYCGDAPGRPDLHSLRGRGGAGGRPLYRPQWIRPSPMPARDTSLRQSPPSFLAGLPSSAGAAR